MDALRDARALVTGGTGFVGSHLVRRLVAEGAEVHVLTSRVSTEFPVRLADLRGRVAVHEGDLADRDAVGRVVARARPTLVFHLGAFTHVAKSWDRAGECVQTNVGGTVNLLHALDGAYDRFVNMGTSEIYGAIDPPYREDAAVNPMSPYAVTKAAAEQFCRIAHGAHGWPIVRVRAFNAYGPAQSPDRVVPEIVVRALRGQPLAMTAGSQTREFNYVEDLVDGLVLAATVPGVEGELFNLGCGEEVSIRDLAVTLLGLMGDPVRPDFGALPERPGEIARMVSDSTKARDRLGWAPRHSLAEGLERTIAWYREELARPWSPFAL